MWAAIKAQALAAIQAPKWQSLQEFLQMHHASATQIH